MAYLDHAATTPMLPVALDAYTRAASEFGNASSLHAAGRRARRVVEEARELIAERLGAEPIEVIFTGGGTESDNLAVKGMFWSRRGRDPARNVLLVSTVEHHAVLDAAEWLREHQGAVVEWVPVERDGLVSVSRFAELLARHGASVALATVMWANNEVGAIEPIPELAAAATATQTPFHSDAVQALGQVPIRFGDSGVSALTVTAHKIGGPYGVGALLLRRGSECTPLLHGGGHEGAVRSGTVDVAGVAGFAAAVDYAVSKQEQAAERLARLRDELMTRVRASFPDAIINGPAPTHSTESDRRLPGNVHVTFPGCDGDALLMLLDAAGVECSTGSACTAGVAQPSHVLLAMGLGVEHANSSLRFSLGHTSTKDDLDAAIEALETAVPKARQALEVAAQLLR